MAAMPIRTVRSRLGRAVLLCLTVALSSGLVAPGLALGANQAPTGTLARIETIDINLYRPYALARQYTSYWCVPASVQSMLNLVRGTTNRSRDYQGRYAWHVKRLNRYTYYTRGNDPQGWAATLDQFVAGDWHYDDHWYTSQGVAIRAIVESIDRTGHPVGIVVDRGTHAWTVLGFRAERRDGDADTQTILGLYVTGPLYGRDPWPYKYLTVAQFATRFTRYHESSRSVVWEGHYVIVSE
jgi:hypothetical protein